jgi:hypothetical protein
MQVAAVALADLRRLMLVRQVRRAFGPPFLLREL